MVPSTTPAPAPHPRVLIADDDALVARTFSRTLTREGFIVEVVHSGQSALERLRRPPPVDLLLLDIAMPVVDGRDVLAKLQNQPGGSNIPVLVVSGSEDEYVRHLVAKLGARDMLQKPVSPESLVTRVRRLLHV